MRHGALEKMSFVESDHAICAVTRSGAGGGELQCPADHYATPRKHTLDELLSGNVPKLIHVIVTSEPVAELGGLETLP